MPFVTEEIWQRFAQEGSISVAPWPERHPEHRGSAWSIDAIQDVVTRVRQFRGDHQIPPRQGLELRIRSASKGAHIEGFAQVIARLTGARTISFVDDGADASGCARLLVEPDIEILIPLAGVIDVEASTSRLRRRLDSALADAERSAAKLGNPQFTSKAPEEVVAKERAKLEALEREAASLREQLAQIGGP
jgi:valyl-tRNA synthetase